jgi:hypothetical protein
MASPQPSTGGAGGYIPVAQYDARVITLGGVAVGPEGQLYVVDDGRDVVVVTNPDSTFVTELRFAQGANLGQRNDVAVDELGNVFVLDTDNSRIVTYAPDGEQVTEWGGTVGFDAPSIFDARAIAAGNGIVYVLHANRIERYTTDGEYLDAWSAGIEQYLRNTDFAGIALADDLIHVLNSVAGMVVTLDRNGALVRDPLVLGEIADLHAPYSLAVDEANAMLIADQFSGQIVRITLDGDVTHRWQARTATDRPQALLHVASAGDRVITVDGERASTTVYVAVEPDDNEQSAIWLTRTHGACDTAITLAGTGFVPNGSVWTSDRDDRAGSARRLAGAADCPR